MGFWDWFKGKQDRVKVVDRIWMNQEAKFQGLCKKILGQLPSSMILVVAHFLDTYNRLKTVFAQENLQHGYHHGSLSAVDYLRLISGVNPVSVLLVQAEALVPDEFPNLVSNDLPPLPIVVGERHFLRSHDERIVNFARSLGRPCQISFHGSLEDPLLKLFAGEWVGQMLRNLGMTDSEPIESEMVSRRIPAAQAKIAKRVTYEQKANSAEEWLQLNLPG